MNKIMFEYIWLLPSSPNVFGSKTKVFDIEKLPGDILQSDSVKVEDLPEWYTSDDEKCLILKPAKVVFHPTYSNAYLVLCSLYNLDNTPHILNKRDELVDIVEMYNDDNILMCIQDIVSDSDGDSTHQTMEEHVNMSVVSGLSLSEFGEYYSSMWKYKIGPSLMVDIADQLMISRYILNSHRLNVFPDLTEIIYEISTNDMRQENGLQYIEAAKAKVEESAIHPHTVKSGRGYLQFKSNEDPYVVIKNLVEKVCNN